MRILRSVRAQPVRCRMLRSRVRSLLSRKGAAVEVAHDEQGSDRLLPMLRRASKKGLNLAVVGEAPELPFGPEQFDAVVAALVITHFVDCAAGLDDFLRVLKPGGKLGVTTWAAGSSNYARLWRETAEQFAGAVALAQTIDTYQPGSDPFTEPGRVAEALRGAGFENIQNVCGELLISHRNQ